MKYLWAVSWMTIKLQREQKKKQKFFMRLHFIEFNSSALIPLYCHNLYISVYFHSASWDTCGKKTTSHNHIPFTFHAQFQLQVISCSTSSFLCAIYSWTRWLWFAPTFAWICFRIPAGCQSIKGTGKSSYGASSAAQRNVTSSRRIKLLG